MEMQEELRRLPSVDRLLQEEAVAALVERWGHELTVEAAREALDAARQAIREGAACPLPEALSRETGGRLVALLRPTLHPAINATGVIVHTNLGRASLSAEARAAMDAVAPSRHGASGCGPLASAWGLYERQPDAFDRCMSAFRKVRLLATRVPIRTCQR